MMQKENKQLQKLVLISDWSNSIVAMLISLFSGNFLSHLFGCKLTGFLPPRLLGKLFILDNRAAVIIWEGFSGEEE